jgi:hypothetical protein
MEAEYIALSAGMRVLLHLRRIHEVVCTRFTDCTIPFDPKSNVSQVFEDNHACFVLATMSQCIQHPVPVLHSRLYYSLTITNAQDQSCSNQEQGLGHTSEMLLRLQL